MKYITFLSVPPPVVGFRDTQTLRRTAHCCGLCSVESHCWLLLLPPIDIYDWACGWGGHTAIEPSKTDLEPQFWTGNCLKWQLASLRGELHHLRLSNHPGQNSWNHNIYVCMYVDAQVLGVRLEYFISSKGEFAAGQLVIWHFSFACVSFFVLFFFCRPFKVRVSCSQHVIMFGILIWNAFVLAAQLIWLIQFDRRRKRRRL